MFNRSGEYTLFSSTTIASLSASAYLPCSLLISTMEKRFYKRSWWRDPQRFDPVHAGASSLFIYYFVSMNIQDIVVQRRGQVSQQSPKIHDV
jgi:hypothetical protein